MPATKLEDGTLDLIADKVVALFGVGNRDPSAGEIHRAIEVDDSVGGVSRGVVLAALNDVKAKLEERGFLLCPVSDAYYDKGYRDEPPETKAQARDCLPIGRGKQTVGLRMWESTGDAISEAWLNECMKRGAGMISANATRGRKALESGRMSTDALVRMLQRAGNRAQPKGEPLPESIRRQLTPGSGGDGGTA